MPIPSSWPTWVKDVRAALACERQPVPHYVYKRLAIDLILVTTKCRSAMLIDTCTLSLRQIQALAALFEQHDLDNLSLILYAPAHQVFVVNRQSVIESIEKDQNRRVFVDPRYAHQPVYDTPAGVQTILSRIQEACVANEHASIIVSRNSMADARYLGISACGWLLGYPVVYLCSTVGDALDISHMDASIQCLPVAHEEAEAQWSMNEWDTSAAKFTDLSLLLVEATMQYAPVPQMSAHEYHPVMAYTLPVNMPHAQELVDAWEHQILSHWQARRVHLPEFLRHVTFHVQSVQIYMDRIAL